MTPAPTHSLDAALALDLPVLDEVVSVEPAVEVSFEDLGDDDPCGPIEALVGWSDLDPATQRLRGDVLHLMAESWLPHAAEHFLDGRFPRDLFSELGRLGALGTGLVGRGGQPPLGKVATCAVMHAIEYGDGGLRCAATIQDSVLHALVRFGDAAQQQRWVEPLLRGDSVASFALTEPQAGSDLRALSTRAARDGRDWVLSGHKGWVTNAPAADVLLIWARTGERNDMIRGFLVERDTPGLRVEPIRHVAALRAATVGRATLDGVRVPERALLPHAWGLSDVNACLDYNRMTVASGVMGAARFCLEAALRHAGSRQQFGVPIGAKQLVQDRITDMANRVALGELLMLHMARLWEQRPLSRFEVSLVKRNNCAAALDVTRSARAVLGAAGIDFASHVARHLLNVEASSTYGGTHEIHGLAVARVLTGLDAW